MNKLKQQTTFEHCLKEKPKLNQWVEFFQSKGFELQPYTNDSKFVHLTYRKWVDYQKNIPCEIKTFTWSPLEQKILREAKIPIPEPRTITTFVASNVTIQVDLRNLKRKVDGTVSYTNMFTQRSLTIQINNSININELTFQLEGLMDIFQTDFEKQKIMAKDELDKRFDEEMEYYYQYCTNCELLKGYLGEYFHSSPEIELINTISIQVQTVSDYIYPEPSIFKPQYNRENNTMCIYDGHKTGVFHINTEYSIIKNTLVFFVTTWSARDKFAQRRAQTYFFEPIMKQFLTKKSNRIKRLGDINKWKYSFWWSTEEPEEKYRRCFVCGSKLHFPAIPTKVLDIWVYQIKPCCTCFAKMKKDPEFEQQMIQKYIDRYQTEFEEKERDDQNKEDQNKGLNPLISN